MNDESLGGRLRVRQWMEHKFSPQPTGDYMEETRKSKEVVKDSKAQEELIVQSVLTGANEVWVVSGEQTVLG